MPLRVNIIHTSLYFHTYINFIRHDYIRTAFRLQEKGPHTVWHEGLEKNLFDQPSMAVFLQLSNLSVISLSGAAVTRLTTKMKTLAATKAGKSS